jgi:glycosyltransferase involved in cell wall biosynthesis
MVLLEAIDAEVPVVATRVGGIPTVVGPDEALLVETEDPAALRTAIASIAGDRPEADRRTKRAVARLESEFSSDAWLAAHEALYARSLARPVGGDGS